MKSDHLANLQTPRKYYPRQCLCQKNEVKPTRMMGVITGLLYCSKIHEFNSDLARAMKNAERAYDQVPHYIEKNCTRFAQDEDGRNSDESE